MRAFRRVVLVLGVAVLSSGVGSALFASPAAAGDVNTDSGLLSAAVYNASPYPWTLVAAQSTAPSGNSGGGWTTYPGSTVQPGGGTVYQLNPWQRRTPGICFGNDADDFDAYITYRVDVLGGPPEYANVVIWGSWTDNYCLGRTVGGPVVDPGFAVYFTSSPPPSGYDPWNASGAAPSAQIPNPQLTYAHNVPFLFDQTVAVVGNYTIDASTPQGQPFVDLLNAVCPSQDSGDSVLVGGSCSFTQMTPVTYGPGKLTESGEFDSCVQKAPPPPNGQAPPDDDPNYAVADYQAAQSASLSVGGGVSVGVEGELFGVIAAEATVSVEAEHEWEDTVTYDRSAKIYIPANSRGFIWVSPTVGRITGTLVATIGSATFTANNFTEVRSGVTGVATDPRVQPIPAFSVVTKTRSMTSAEKSAICGTTTVASRLAARRALKHKPPARLVAGRSVAHVALGDTDETVLRRLGWPAERRFPLNPCQGMEGCTAVRGLHGTFNYKKRKLSVVLGPDRRVAALIYSGSLSTKDGAGKDDSMARLRAEFPRISCAKFARRIDCAVASVSGRGTVRTVFRLTDRLRGAGTSWEVDKVLMYVERRGKGNV